MPRRRAGSSVTAAAAAAASPAAAAAAASPAAAAAPRAQTALGQIAHVGYHGAHDAPFALLFVASFVAAIFAGRAREHVHEEAAAAARAAEPPAKGSHTIFVLDNSVDRGAFDLGLASFHTNGALGRARERAGAAP
jgi:hypothetical protein